MRVVVRDVAVGFLYRQASAKVLLHLRDVDAPPNPGKWAFFGGRTEPEDGGDLLATWCREMRQELGVTLNTAGVVSLRHGTYGNGRRWHDFYFACHQVILRKPSGELCGGPDGGRECGTTCFASEGPEATYVASTLVPSHDSRVECSARVTASTCRLDFRSNGQRVSPRKQSAFSLSTS